MGSLLSVGGLFGVSGLGTGRTAAADHTDTEPDEVVHLDYDDYGSWDDVYRMSNGESDNISFVSDPIRSGETAIQLRVQEGAHWGVSTHYDFEDGLLELDGRVHFALNTDWEMETENHCRIWNCAMGLGEASAGGGVPDGTNGWSNRLYVTTRDTSPEGPFHLMSYTYHMDQNQDHDFILDGEEYAVQQPAIVPGQWYEFEYYVRVNTIDDGTANSDGVVQYWLDGDLIYDRQDLRFTDDLDDNIIDSSGPVGYYGGRYVAPQNLYAYYDDHSMALDGRFEDAREDPEESDETTDPEESEQQVEIELPDGIDLPGEVDLPDGTE
ncbi:hypothetical protein RBH26_20395 [Natronolimnohabitans sp. A-GB9]|uniref:hypothetical protein n=1 Tax=Natronolimnohabitans sp. A-GB9 TaxID=3069757 RepID=UPI0027AFAC83|nr:hypothetical protein [Natronolimnohabitans sp. A-GB9]MDQ2052804.1 hypothetical protein [Natronolimnohabitans sp. A-GB9]